MSATQFDSFLNRRNLYGSSFGRYLRSLGPIDLLSEMRGNMGDHLIWAGTRDLLGSIGLDYSEVPVDEVGNSYRPGRTLVVPGSGAFHRFWNEWLPATVVIAAEHYDRVVVLPSTFDCSVDVVKEAVSLPNVFCFARDADSYAEVAPYGRAALALDSALYYLPFEVPMGGGAWRREGPRVLVALRTDQGQMPLEAVSLIDGVNDDVSVTTQSLEEFVAVIGDVDVVVTDRLHVAISGLFLGRFVHYFDPYDRKLTGYFNFAFRGAFDDALELTSTNWLLEQGIVRRRETA